MHKDFTLNIFYTSSHIHTFFISNTLISNAKQKLAKNQENAKQHLEAKKTFSHSSPALLSKNNIPYSKN